MTANGIVQSDWEQRLKAAIPWGASTCSKAPLYRPDEPAVIVRGQGCRVWDEAGKSYIDYRNALGPITLGYQFPAVDDAIKAQLASGIVFGHCHPLEAEVAEMLCDVIPCAEQARFLKTGGEAIAACIRAARAYTNRDHVIQIGYNGWLNSIDVGGRALPGQPTGAARPGVPEQLAQLHHTCEWNDTEQLQQLFDEHAGAIAAVVVAADYATMQQGETFYPALRKITQQHGAVLVFDEIVTGFRIARAGVQEYFSVTPDMAVYAKGMANGMPLSAYVGSRELMAVFEKAVVSSTYGGETLSLAAAKATIDTYLQQPVIEHFWQQGRRLWAAVNAICQKRSLPVSVQGFAPCPAWRFDDKTLAEAFFRACYRRGLSLYNVSYINFSHTDADIDQTIERFEQVCDEVASGKP